MSLYYVFKLEASQFPDFIVEICAVAYDNDDATTRL
jgi:hypothetical protein